MTPGAGPSAEGERADLRARLVSQGRVRLRGDAGVRGHWQERGTRRAERPECAGEGVRRCWAGRAEGGGARWAAGVGAGLRKREGRGVRAAAGLERGVGPGHGDWAGVLGREHGIGWRKEVRVGPGKPGLWAERGGKLGQD